MTDVLHRFILAPTLGGISAIERWGQSNIVSLFRGPRLASENAALRAQVAVLTQQSRALRDDADENARLRVLLKFEEHSPRRLLPAEVLALKPFAQRDSAIFSRGARSGVGVKQVALGPNGALVGQVTGVTQTTCDVMLLTDALSSVGAQVLPIIRLRRPSRRRPLLHLIAKAIMRQSLLPPPLPRRRRSSASASETAPR